MRRANTNIWKNKFIDIEHPLLEQLHDIMIILSDLEVIESYSKFYTEKFSMKGFAERVNKSENLPEYDMDFMISMDSISKYIIILYAKCFDQSSRGRRHYKLTGEIFKKNEELTKNHQALMDWRNQYVVHDENLLGERSKFKIGFDQNGVLKTKAPSPPLYFSGGELTEISHIQGNIDYMKVLLIEKAHEIESKVDDSIMELLAKNRNFLLGKITRNEKITSEEIRKLQGYDL